MASVVTKKGDNGTTGTWGGERLKKSHPRIIASGLGNSVNVSLGKIVNHLRKRPIDVEVDWIEMQRFIMLTMADLSKLGACELRKRSSTKMDMADTMALQQVDDYVTLVEPKCEMKGWFLPGANDLSLLFDEAACITRQYESAVVYAQEHEELHSLQDADIYFSDIIKFLNRLSDLLWIMGRYVSEEDRSFRLKDMPCSEY